MRLNDPKMGVVRIENAQQLMEYVRKPYGISIDNYTLDSEYLTEENVRALFEAIVADCEAGTLSQIYNFHPLMRIESSSLLRDFYSSNTLRVNVDLTNEQSLYLDFGIDSTNVYAWAESMGLSNMMKITLADTEA